MCQVALDDAREKPNVWVAYMLHRTLKCVLRDVSRFKVTWTAVIMRRAGRDVVTLAGRCNDNVVTSLHATHGDGGASFNTIN